MTGSQTENTPTQQQAGTIEAQLDAALEDSFPASDPVSFVTSQMEDYWRSEDGRPGAPPVKDCDNDSKPKSSHLGPPIR